MAMEVIPSLKLKSPAFHKLKFTRATTHIITCCNIRSSPLSGNDDTDPSIGSDWRSFRARLIAGEQSSKLAMPPTSLVHEVRDQTQTPFALGDKWAHPLHEPEKGCLLVATDKLDGAHIFERTVILLLSTEPIGPTGLILNRPSLMSIKETQSTAFDVAGTFSERPLFFGGPLEDGLFLLNPAQGSSNGPDQVGGCGVFDEVMKGMYYGTKESVGCAAEMVKRGVVGVNDFRFFEGYCGWEREQLRDEIRSGYWRVAACSPSVIGLGSAGGIGLWEEVFGLVGERKLW